MNHYEYRRRIEGACVGDILKIKVNKINKNYIKADIIEIITPSKSRVKPACHLYNACGSCNWQHIEYNEQLKQKKNIVSETIRNIAGIDIPVENTLASPKIEEYRCKVQMPVSQTKVSKRLLLGYYKKNSHELINIKYCPMQPKIINEIKDLTNTNDIKKSLFMFENGIFLTKKQIIKWLNNI